MNQEKKKKLRKLKQNYPVIKKNFCKIEEGLIK
jgi:hypothetical protein